MYCSSCGKQIPEDSIACPECGAAQSGATASGRVGQPVQTQTASKPPYNIMCIIGLVVSAISLFYNLLGIVGIAGVVLSVVGIVQVGRKNESGKVMGIVGIVLGALSSIVTWLGSALLFSLL